MKESVSTIASKRFILVSFSLKVDVSILAACTFVVTGCEDLDDEEIFQSLVQEMILVGYVSLKDEINFFLFAIVFILGLSDLRVFNSHLFLELCPLYRSSVNESLKEASRYWAFCFLSHFKILPINAFHARF